MSVFSRLSLLCRSIIGYFDNWRSELVVKSSGPFTPLDRRSPLANLSTPVSRRETFPAEHCTKGGRCMLGQEAMRKDYGQPVAQPTPLHKVPSNVILWKTSVPRAKPKSVFLNSALLVTIFRL